MASDIPLAKPLTDTSITAALSAHASHEPDATALVFEAHTISWYSLDEQVDRLAAWLSQRCARGARLVLCLPNSPALVVFFLAGVRAGCEVQVFDREWPATTINALLVDVSPTLLLDTTTRRAGHPEVLLENPHLGFSTFADAVGAGRPAQKPTEPAATTPFYTGFTSGSTGLPKGFRRDHRSWLASFRHDAVECPLRADDTVIAPGALSHSLFLYALLRGLHAGVSVVFCRRFAARSVARLIQRHRVSILYSVPAQMSTLLQLAPAYYHSLRRVLCSGAKCPEAWRARFRRVFQRAELCEFYGASELSFVAIAKDSEAVPANSVGRAFDGVRIHIRDGGGGDLPAGRIGQVFVDSDMMFLGYTDEAETVMTASGGVIGVGDRGYLDIDGFLFLVGRADRMVVVAGKNIYPEEVENVLLAHPAIRYAAVLAVQDDKRGQRLVAVLQCHQWQSLARAELIRYCWRHLPQYKVPRAYGVCKDWPLTHSGKTDTLALADAWNARRVSPLI